MRLLVTGAGRTGTTWLTHALRSCGIPAQHEVAFSIDRHGDDDWTAEVSWLAAPFTPIDDAHVVHLVRHPLDQIRSRAAWGSFEDRKPSGRYDPRIKGRWAIDHVPEIELGDTPIERAAIHWTYWNQLIIGADELLRIEDMTAETVERLAQIVDPRARLTSPLPARSNQATHPTPRPTWADVEHVDGLVELAHNYGYEVPTCA